ncbi:TPA: aldehyde dehydrogenase family protein, partial [Klebsiella pneumoniae]|nr:aldehyde dehydrogenase family protein [Klebsiella pneumoniae]
MIMSNVNHELNLPSAGKTGLFFDGAWQATAEGQELAVINPCFRSEIIKIGASQATDVDRAIASAKAAFPSWRRLAARARGAMLIELGNRITANCEDIARVLAAETGNALRT